MSRTETRKRKGTSTFDTVFASRAKPLESLPPRNVSRSTVESVITYCRLPGYKASDDWIGSWVWS